jgi:hypothetical protein
MRAKIVLEVFAVRPRTFRAHSPETFLARRNVMGTGLLAAASRLSDRELLRRVSALAGNERQATVELIAHLAEVDRRKLYLGEGYRSLFRYCVDTLRLGEQATYKRMVAARACRRFPSQLGHLADGSLNLSTLRLIAPHLTRENFDSVVAEAVGRRKREVDKLVARLAPRPDVPASVRKLPAKAVVVSSLPGPVEVPGPERAEVDTSQKEGPSQHGPADPPRLVLPAAPPPSPPVAALAPDRYRIQFTVTEETHDTLREVQSLLRREIPDGDVAAIFDRALKLLLEDTARKKLAATDRPRPRQVGSGKHSRYKPAELVRAVWRRDSGRCAFVAKNGRRCGADSFIEFHHLDPHGLGGEMTEENISLRCRAHNQYEAELAFGPFVPKAREQPAVSTNGPTSRRPLNQLRPTVPGDSSVDGRRRDRTWPGAGPRTGARASGVT